MAAGLYYTMEQYIARFGDDEAIRLTDADNIGQPDPFAFDQAIADASADMDAYLGTRYALPIAAPLPRLLTSVAAALVREKLHGTFPTETVTMAANQARKTLGDLASGKATLTVDTGETPDVTGNSPSGIMVSAPERIFTSERLAKF